MGERSTEKPLPLRRPRIGQDIHVRSPMLRRLERENLMSLVRKGARTVLIAGGLGVLGGAGGIAWAVFEHPSSSSGSSESGPCSSGENKLDCLDRLYEEEQGESFPAGLQDDPDGCSAISVDEQLQSVLCCPHVSPDPGTCPTDESLPGDIEIQEPPSEEKAPPPPPPAQEEKSRERPQVPAFPDWAEVPT